MIRIAAIISLIVITIVIMPCLIVGIIVGACWSSLELGWEVGLAARQNIFYTATGRKYEQ